MTLAGGGFLLYPLVFALRALRKHLRGSDPRPEQAVLRKVEWIFRAKGVAFSTAREGMVENAAPLLVFLPLAGVPPALPRCFAGRLHDPRFFPQSPVQTDAPGPCGSGAPALKNGRERKRGNVCAQPCAGRLPERPLRVSAREKAAFQPLSLI